MAYHSRRLCRGEHLGYLAAAGRVSRLLQEVSIKTVNLKLKHYIHFGDALDGPPGPATAKKAKRAHMQQVPSHDSMARSKGKEPSRVGAAADETVIDRATGQMIVR